MSGPGTGPTRPRWSCVGGDPVVGIGQDGSEGDARCMGGFTARTSKRAGVGGCSAWPSKRLREPRSESVCFYRPALHSVLGCAGCVNTNVLSHVRETRYR